MFSQCHYYDNQINIFSFASGLDISNGKGKVEVYIGYVTLIKNFWTYHVIALSMDKRKRIVHLQEYLSMDNKMCIQPIIRDWFIMKCGWAIGQLCGWAQHKIG
jgi:hypothetical protein